jgi:hypothetical protein
MVHRKESFIIYTKGLPENKGVVDRVYEFKFEPLYTNLGDYTSLYRITIPAIAINIEQEYAEFTEQNDFIYGLRLPHLNGWCCSIDLEEKYLNEFKDMLATVEHKI